VLSRCNLHRYSGGKSGGGWGRGGRLSLSGGKVKGQKVKLMGPGRLYNKLVKAGIGGVVHVDSP
jgi:hypothetical protein